MLSFLPSEYLFYGNFLLTIEYNDTFWKALVEIEKYHKISSVTTV